MKSLLLGCYVKNDFFFKESPESYIDGMTWEREDKPTSAMSCGTACYKNDLCTQGWSYQQATQRCLFLAKDISTEMMDKLQPYGHIMETDKTIGWATGLKACWQTRESLILLIFSLMSRIGLSEADVVVVGGGMLHNYQIPTFSLIPSLRNFTFLF